jgi:hypothetical protein
MNASTARYALPADLKVLEPLRDLLGELPAVFSTGDNRRIRPLAIGIDQHLIEIAVAGGADADQAAAVVRQVLRSYCRSGAYLSALNQPDARRHALDGTPVEAARGSPRRPTPGAVRHVGCRERRSVSSWIPMFCGWRRPARILCWK